jgi:soluble lytic murein transglycosylase-like protein
MPGTAKELGVDPWNPEQNLRGGARYLAQMYKKYGDWRTALMAYNAGPGNVDAGRIPKSTIAYADKILREAGML